MLLFSLYCFSFTCVLFCIILLWLNKFLNLNLNLINDRLGIKTVIPRIPVKRIKLCVYDVFFKVSASKLWNTLPKWVNSETSSLPAFKKCLDKYLSNIPDCPPVQGYVTANNNSLLEY